VERRFGMPWPESVVGKLREQILALRAFWDCWQNGTKLNFRGEYYKLTLMSPFFSPPPLPAPLFFENGGGLGGGIPIYIAGVNPGLARLAGELCQGFHAHPFHSPRYLRDVILPGIEPAKPGRPPAEDIGGFRAAFVATTPREREECVNESFYAHPSCARSWKCSWGETAARSLHASRTEG
jgi:alkanesulfonate monooxygenase SsuD/methylene tetrahydromethanopterin reductase-like flavin-dependent oxidoreductase (luciferase family)